MSFKKLDKKELLRTAEEDFAVEVDNSWTKVRIIETLESAGITFGLYLEANPEKASEYTDIPDNISTEQIVKPAEVGEGDEKKILIKMIRDNLLYEIGKYRWTQKHPYVAVSIDDANRILIKEEGFRQATPAELSEYYA